MTAPDSRDSAVLLPCPFCGSEAERIDFGPGSGDNEGGSCIACTKCQASGPVEFGYKENFVANWNRRDLARGPQQAGGEDGVEDRYCDDLLDWLWKEAGEQSAQYQAAAALMLDRRALQAEVARLRERTLEMERQRDDTTKAKQAAEARLAEVWTDARTLAASVHGAFGALGSDPPEPILKLANRYFLMKRRGRRSAALNGGQDDA